MNILDLWRKHTAVVSCRGAAWAQSLFCPHVSSNGQHGPYNRISLSLQIKELVWLGGKNIHLILFNLILTSYHSSIPNWRKTYVKKALRVSFAFFVVSPLCLFAPPLCVLCRPSELCVHFDLSATTSQAFGLYLFLHLYGTCPSPLA